MTDEPGDDRDHLDALRAAGGVPDADLERALRATRAELAALPRPSAPPEVVARWMAAVTGPGVRDGTRPVGGSDDTRSGSRLGGGGDRAHPGSGDTRPLLGAGARAARRARRAVRGWPAVAAGLVAVLVGVLAALGATDRPAADPVRVARLDLAALGTAAVGVRDVGDLADPQLRAACLAAVGVAADGPLLGGRRVVLDGRPGVLLVLGSGELGRLRLVVVDPACGPGADLDNLLVDTTTPR